MHAIAETFEHQIKSVRYPERCKRNRLFSYRFVRVTVTTLVTLCFVLATDLPPPTRQTRSDPPSVITCNT